MRSRSAHPAVRRASDSVRTRPVRCRCPRRWADWGSHRTLRAQHPTTPSRCRRGPRPEGGVALQSDDRQIEDIGDGLELHSAPRTATLDPDLARTVRIDGPAVEHPAKLERHSLQNRTYQVPAAVLGMEADECGRHGRLEPCALAREERQEDQPIGTGTRLDGVVEQRRDGLPGSHGLANPEETRSGRMHGIEPDPAAVDGVAESAHQRAVRSPGRSRRTCRSGGPGHASPRHRAREPGQPGLPRPLRLAYRHGGRTHPRHPPAPDRRGRQTHGLEGASRAGSRSDRGCPATNASCGRRRARCRQRRKDR